MEVKMSKEFQIKDLKPMTSIKVPKELIGKGCRFISEEDYVEYLRMKETAYYVNQCGLKEKDQQIAELQKQLEEKERYEYYLGTNSIKDNKTNQIYDYVVDLINQQDKRIKELEEEIQQLKQSQKQLANSKLEMLHDMFCSTINNRILQNYVCSIIRGEIEELKIDGKL